MISIKKGNSSAGTSTTTEHADYLLTGAEKAGKLSENLEPYNCYVDTLQSKKDIRNDILTDIIDKKTRNNGVENIRILITPPAEIEKEMSRSDIIEFTKRFLDKNLPFSKGLIVYHKGSMTAHQHVHILLSAKDLNNKNIRFEKTDIERLKNSYYLQLKEEYPTEYKIFEKNKTGNIENTDFRNEKGKNIYHKTGPRLAVASKYLADALQERLIVSSETESYINAAIAESIDYAVKNRKNKMYRNKIIQQYEIYQIMKETMKDKIEIEKVKQDIIEISEIIENEGFEIIKEVVTKTEAGKTIKDAILEIISKLSEILTEEKIKMQQLIRYVQKELSEKIRNIKNEKESVEIAKQIERIKERF